MADPFARWLLVSRGMELKVAAALMMISVAILLLMMPQWGMTDPARLVSLFLLAVVADFVGRCLCLAVPLSFAWTLAPSVAFQFVSLGCLAGMILLGRDTATISFLALSAMFLQALAAVYFTRFLKDVTVHLRARLAKQQVDVLGQRLRRTMLWGSAILFVIFPFVAFWVLVLGSFGYGVGFLVTLPAGVVLLLPWIAFGLGVMNLMVFSYLKTLMQTRQAIRQFCSFDAMESVDLGLNEPEAGEQ